MAPSLPCRYAASLPGRSRLDGVQSVQREAEVDQVVGGEGGSAADLEGLGRHVERLDGEQRSEEPARRATGMDVLAAIATD